MSELSLLELNGDTVLCRMRKNEDVVANPKGRATCKGVAEPSNLKRPRTSDNVEAKPTCNAEVEPPIKMRKRKVQNPESENNAQINPSLELNINGDDGVRSNVESELNHDDDQAVPEPFICSDLFQVAVDHGYDPIVPEPEQCILRSDFEVECGGDDDVQTELLPDNFEHYLENLLQSNTESDLNSENQSLNQEDDLAVPEPVISSQFLQIAKDHDDHLTVLEQPVSSSEFKFEFRDDDQVALLPEL